MLKDIESIPMENMGEIKLCNLQKLNILTGCNGVGKTSILNYIYSTINSDNTYKKLFKPTEFKPLLPFKLENLLNYDKSKYTYIFIDEIDAGLDFKNVAVCAENLVSICKENENAQMFIVGYGIEFFKVLVREIEKQDLTSIAVYNITDTKLKRIKAYRYDITSILHSIKVGNEFRD